MVKATRKEIDCIIASSFGQFGMLFQNVSQKVIVKLPFFSGMSKAYFMYFSQLMQVPAC